MTCGITTCCESQKTAVKRTKRRTVAAGREATMRSSALLHPHAFTSYQEQRSNLWVFHVLCRTSKRGPQCRQRNHHNTSSLTVDLANDLVEQMTPAAQLKRAACRVAHMQCRRKHTYLYLWWLYGIRLCKSVRVRVIYLTVFLYPSFSLCIGVWRGSSTCIGTNSRSKGYF
jgi:hypothetical protein